MMSKHIHKLIPLFLISSAMLWGCGAHVSGSIPGSEGATNLNFRYRNDSARPGDFRGPFTGTIRDRSSKFPISAATVSVYYYFTKKGRPYKTVTQTVKTDNNGKYFIEKLKKFPCFTPGLRLAKIDMFVWHQSYLPHSASRISGVVTQFDHLVLLQRNMTPLRSSKLLMTYIGTVGYDASIADEYYRASQELSKQRTVKLDSGALLLPALVQRALGKHDNPELGELRSNVEESGYILSFKDGTVVSWNVWSALSRQAKNRQDHFAAQLKEKTTIHKFGTNIDARMGISDAMRIILLRFKKEGTVVAIGCSLSACTPATLLSLTHFALKRRSLLMFMEDWSNE
ncbi:carboxypeptidase-like regulatory domain-containing protein [Myxococcota bacterium]|nr:carboxypeptidase-like regulatory domain-containing protein [Myxococcota bacterium]